MRRRLPAFALLLTLVACHRAGDPAKAPSDPEAGTPVATLKTAGGSTEIAVPGLGTTLKVPAFNLGGGHVDLGGMTLYPGTQVTGMEVRDTARGHKGRGLVRLDFTSPATPAPIAAYYRSAAAQAGFTVDPAGGDRQVRGAKADGDGFTLTLAPAEGGSTGRILIGGR